MSNRPKVKNTPASVSQPPHQKDTRPVDAPLVIGTATFHQGPLPPPEILKGYDAVKPGTSDLIIAMAQKEQEQRHRVENISLEIENFSVKSEFKYASRGQNFGFTIAIVAILTSGIVVAMGQPWGAAISFAGLASLIGKFLDRKKDDRDENTLKD